MTSVEKRRSGRKSGRHRKQSDGGYSDTSSGGSFLDETDREVSSLTDRAFRSLCIGDEAVYNDSDLCSSSPCTQTDRQMAFSQSGQGRDRMDREGEEFTRTAHENFNLRMQQGQDWIHGGMYGAEIQRDPQWEVYGARTQGRVSATFQHSFVETAQQEEFLGEEQLSLLSNGATELSTQQRRSRSRVSSLIRAFNSEGQKDGAGMDGKWNGETSWDKSALMSIQRELSEFSTSYQQDFNSGHFPPAGPFSSRDTNFYTPEVAAVPDMNSAPSFMRSSHSKHSMSAHFNCNSNFFIHSEFSPFKIWRDHNRFSFPQAEVSGFMHCSEFPKWYETPMYKELSLEAQPQGPYRFEESIRHSRNTLASGTLPRSTSTSKMLQKASAVEKRCESELTGQRKRTQSLGNNRFPSQRPSTASPTSEMSRRVQDTISSVKALQKKIKMMTEQNIATGMTENQLFSNDNFIPCGINGQIVAPNAVNNNTSTTPFNISQLLTPSVPAHQEAETSEAQQYDVSSQPVEHPPVRAESRGATPDVRMSSYKSRATNLLFNLKDNRKRVKSTYSPTKFKGLETQEKSKQPSTQEPRDTVIDIPDFPDQDIQLLQVSSRTNDASHLYVNQNHSPGLSLTTPHSQPAHTGQYSEYTSSNYQTAQIQSEMYHQSGFTGSIPENYASYQPANGQNLHQDLSSFTPYKQGMIDNRETPGGDLYRLKPSYTATEMSRLNEDNNQPREYSLRKANAEQHFNETVGREFTKQDRYQQLKDNTHDYSNASSQDSWGQTNSQETEHFSLKTVSPRKQEMTASMEKDQHAQAYQRANMIKEELHSPRDKYTGEHLQSMDKEVEKTHLRESVFVETNSQKKAGSMNPNISNQLPQNAPLSDDTIENPAYYGQQQPGAFKDKYTPQRYYGHNKENERKDDHLTEKYNRYTDQKYSNQQALYSSKDTSMLMQETGQRKQYTPKVYEIQSLQQKEAKAQFEHNMQEKSLAIPENASTPTIADQVEDKQLFKTEQGMAEHIKAQHAQAELAKAQRWAQVEQPKAESAGLILAGQTGSEEVKPEQAKTGLTEHERVNQAKAAHIKEEKGKEEWTEQSRGKHPECTREEQTKAEETRVQTVTEEPRNITEEHLGEELCEQAEAKHAEAERLKEEHIKTELAKTEQAGQARLQQAKIEQARRERIKAEQIKEQQLRAKQVEREQMEAEQIRTERVKAEQAKAECRKADEAKLEQIHKQQAKAEQLKTNVIEVEKVKAIHVQVDDVKQEKAEENSIQANCVNAEQLAISKANMEQTKGKLVKAELTKTETMQERSAKLTAKVSVTQQIKSEPDKVEQVKTELAKAKAELAKIKEKMRGEQKDKVRNTVLTKEDGIKRDAPLKLIIKTNEEYKNQDQATQMHQQAENSVVVSRQHSDQANRGADDYERLREKYGLIDTTSPNRNKVSAAENVPSNDANETPVVTFEKVETTNNEKSKDKSSPTSTAKTANTEHKVASFKPSEFIESQYVYSESSKEFKLSGGNYLPTTVDKRANSETLTDKVKVDRVKPLKHTDSSQQRDCDLVKLIPLERSPKLTEHSLGPAKGQHFTPLRALSSKERAQTKQEILTSKIKAHAEKEISAIKEKGFAVRDGFISKHSSKQLAGNQSNTLRQVPPSKEVSKKQESTMPSNTTPKHQMEHLGIQMEPVKSVSPPSSATIPFKSTTGQVVDHLQKPVPKEPMKNNDNVPKPYRETKQTTMGTNESSVGNQSEIKSPIRSKEQAPMNKQGKGEANREETSGKQNEELKDNPAINTDHLNKKKEDPSQATGLLEAESSKTMAIKKAKNEDEDIHEDSAPSLHLVFGQNKIPVADDSLQITGIFVTVREREPSMDSGQRNNSTEKPINVKECSYPELDTFIPSSGLEVSKGNTSSNVKPKDGVVKNTHLTVKEDQNKVGVHNYPENWEENSTIETRRDNVSENITMKKTNLQQESSSLCGLQLQEPLAEKGVSSTVSVPTKNKVLAETKPLLYNQDIICETKDSTNETKDYKNETAKENLAKSLRKHDVTSNTEEKDPQRRQTAHTDENLAKVVKTTICSTNYSNRVDAETLMDHDIQPSVKEDTTTVINPPKSRNIDGKSAPPVEEKICDSTAPKPFNKTSPLNHSCVNESTHVTPKHQNKETHIGGKNQGDDDVHIGSIAIRVVPAITENDNQKLAGKQHVPPDEVAANEQTQVALSTITLKNEDITKELTPASSLEDSVGLQCVLSSERKQSNSPKICNQQNSINATSEVIHAENEKPETLTISVKSVDDSKIGSIVGDYFQVQGVAETNNEPQNRTNVGHTSDVVSRGREVPGLLHNKAAISSESRDGKNEDFVLDQSKMKTVGSSPVRKNSETEVNLASEPSDGPAERQRNKNETTGADQAVHIRKHHTENQSNIARERQSSGNSHPTRGNMSQEKPEVKPKPKVRVSTIPEISALADYARLKVIVSEDEENTIQEFPPNKKEGFFPLIQTRHSRRPVFTTDPQDHSVKEKRLPNKTEVKVNKEPKPLVFPITEKEHQRTGMFKLGDKERQEKMLFDAKVSEGVVDTKEKHAPHLKERNKSPSTHLKSRGSEEQAAGTNTQRVLQVEQNIIQPNASTSSSAVNRPRSTVSHHLKPLDNSNPHEKHLRQVYNIEESTATLRRDEKIENEKATIGEERIEKITQERLVTRQEETKEQQQSRAKQLEEKQASRIEEEKRVEDMRVKHMIEENRASLAEEERRAAQREEERRAREREAIAIKIKERRKIEEERRAKLREEEERIKENEWRRMRQQEEERAAQEEQQRRAEEQQRRAAQEEQQRRAEEQQRRAVQEEQQRRAAQEEQQRRAAKEEQQRRAEEQQRRAAKEEQQRRAVQEEQQRRAAQEEQQRRAEEQQRRAAKEEQQRRAEEQQRRAAKEEQQRRAAQEEQQRRAEEQQRRAAQEEQQRRAAQEEQQRRAEEQQKRAAQEEQQMRAEEQQRRAAQEEQQMRAEEQQRRAAQEEQQWRSAQEEQQRRAAQEEQQGRSARIEEQRRAKQIQEKILADIEEKRKIKQKEEEIAAQISDKEIIKLIEEQKIEEQKREEWIRTQTEEHERRAVEKEKTIIKQREEKKAKEQRTRVLEESHAALEEEEKRAAQERLLAQRDDEIRGKKREEDEEKPADNREREGDIQMEGQKKAVEMVDALQYYAITSTEPERKPRERQLCSTLPSQQRHHQSGHASTEDSGSHTRLYRQHAPASPAPSLPRSNTSSPALGAKPLMFRVKDNTLRGSSFTKSVKPRFHKNFGEDFRMGSPMERMSERGEEEQEIMRRNAGTPVYTDTGSNRLSAIKESFPFHPAYSSHDYSGHLPQHRPYSRRSIALDEDDSRSVFSNMSEDVESFATSAADLADLRGLYDYDRPESACSFSSDVSRSLGKPPTVPPKSDKALRRAKRLTTRRIKKELTKTTADSSVEVEKSLQEVSGTPSSSSNEVRSSSRRPVASPHFSSPISLAHAPTLGSSLPSSHTKHQSSHSTFHASPHATGPISLPVASPHAPVSLPVSPPNATGSASQIVALDPTSPTPHHANHQAPVAQYHVESSYPHSYPLTQRKVLQDLGSGQYFVVDVPVQVKTKTFFDPETGKYVQLNVRQSGQSTSRPPQTYPQPQLQPQMQVKLQQQPQAPPANKPYVLYQGNHGYPQNYQPPAINSVPCNSSSAPPTPHQDQQPARESHSYGNPAPEIEQNSEEHRYSPEKTPYMDTVNDKDKTYNTVNNTHTYESFPECDTNSQLAGSSLCENDSPAHSQCQRDIITIGELEDFMEVSDW